VKAASIEDQIEWPDQPSIQNIVLLPADG